MGGSTADRAVRRRLKSGQWFDYADPAALPIPVRVEERLLSRIRPLARPGGAPHAAAAVAAQAKRFLPLLEQAVGPASAWAATAFVLQAVPGTMLGLAGVTVHLLLHDGRLYASDGPFLLPSG